MAERDADRSVSQTVRAQLSLRDQILSGTLRPGERISELQAVRTTGVSRTPPLIRQIDRASAQPFASPSGFVMAQSALPEAQQILLIAQDHHRIVVDAIENREGARAEAIMREHARLAMRNLRLALRNRTHLDLLPALALVRTSEV